MIQKHTTVKHDQYGEVLIKDGKETICPFKPAIVVPVQNALNQTTMQIINFPCCTACPLVTVEKLGATDEKHYIIECTGQAPKDIEIEETEPVQQNTLKLI